jgi:hypothetical protein
MNLSELRDELKLIVQDASLEGYYNTWINDSIASLAQEFDFPALRSLDPFPFSVVNTAWYREAPESFMKKLLRCYNSAGSQVKVLDRLEQLDYKDWDHGQTGTNITHICAFEHGGKKYFGYFPKATETIKVWFYEAPARLEKDSDVPDFCPPQFHSDVILPRIIVKNFELLQDMVKEAPYSSLGYWLQRQRAGLYGSGGTGEIGLINYLAKQRGIRRHGGRDPLFSGGY